MQHLNYSATFPLLLNISNQPTYFMALKDYAGLVKMYAMVNVQQYQIVATGASVEECQSNYYKLLRQNKLDTGEAPILPADEDTVTGIVTALRSAVIDGTTMYYVTLDADNTVYCISAGEVEKVILLNVGDKESPSPMSRIPCGMILSARPMLLNGRLLRSRPSQRRSPSCPRAPLKRRNLKSRTYRKVPAHSGGDF